MGDSARSFKTNLGQYPACGQCKSPIWKLSVNGVPTVLDIELLTLRQELLARLDKRHTYEIKKWRPNFYATYRSAVAIAQSAGRSPLVLASHKCHTPKTTTHPEYFPDRSKYVYTEEVQF
jgi:hypothetical protein